VSRPARLRHARALLTYADLLGCCAGVEKATELDHVEGNFRAGIGADGWDLTTCTPDCLKVGGCEAVNELLKKVGSRNPATPLAQLRLAALSPSSLIAKAASASDTDISVEQCHAHVCCRMRVCVCLSLSYATRGGAGIATQPRHHGV
jgi:hypothetical protein